MVKIGRVFKIRAGIKADKGSSFFLCHELNTKWKKALHVLATSAHYRRGTFLLKLKYLLVTLMCNSEMQIQTILKREIYDDDLAQSSHSNFAQ